MTAKKGNYFSYNLWHFLLLFLVLISNTVFSQKPLPRIITAEEFLLRTSGMGFAFDIAIDTNGYVFFTGSSGVIQFNGENFDIYDPDYDFPNISIERGFDGKLWLDGLTKGIKYIENRRIVDFPLPDSLKKKFKKGCQSIYQTPDKTLHLSPLAKGYYTIDSIGTIINKSEKLSDYHGFFVQQLNDGKWIHYSVFQPAAQNKKMSLYYVDDEENVHLITEMQDKHPVYQLSLVTHADSSMSFSAGTKEIIRFKEKEFISSHSFEYAIIKLFVDSKDLLWVGTIDHGFFRVENLNYSEADHFWSGASAVVAEDIYGGLWFKSDSGSFGYITPIAAPHYSKQSGFEAFDRVEKIKTGNDEVIIEAAGGIYLLKDDEISKVVFPEIEHTEGIQKSYDTPNDFCYNPIDKTYWYAFYGFVLYGDGENWNRIDMDDSLFTHLFPTSIYVSPDGKIKGATKGELFTIEDNKIIPTSESLPHIFSVAVDSENKTWVGKHDGLWVLENGELTRPTDLAIPTEYNKQVTFLFSFQDELWVQQFHLPIVRISGNKKRYVYANGNPITIKNFTIDPSGNLWCVTEKSGSLIKITKTKSELEVNAYGCDDFLRRGKAAESIVATDEFIYNSTSTGLFKTAIKDLAPEKRDPRVVFKEVRINAKPIDLKNTYDLSYAENHINIAFESISFRLIPVEFSYKMEGLDSTWTEDNYENVQYTNLEPGDYNFLVRAKSNKDDWSSPVTLHFHIAKPYWQTWWFRTVMVILIILILYCVYRIRANKIRRQEKAKSKIALEVAQLELRALKAQINPHFIFNSITSVMFYLSQNKTEKAQGYLERFSKLIRKVLESSDKNMVSLVEEVELMRHYIFLESERFQGEPIELKTSFKFLDPETIKIPPTLLQPYIENAIRHGLKLKKGKRTIALDFILKSDSINVTITDNGIGREKATEQDTRTNHKSFGMSISSRRIELLNKKSISQIKIEDLKDANKEAIGTRISFDIPFAKQAKVA